MDDCIALDGFELSALDLGLSLCVWTHLYISDKATSQLSYQALHARVRARQMWLCPPRICYLQIIVQLGDRPVGDPGILEFLLGSIRASTLWEILGLSITSARMQYETETTNTPNLYFKVEHVDKSSALLEPPKVQTSTMNGIVCLFRFNSISSDVDTDGSPKSQPQKDEDNRSEEDYDYGNKDPVELLYHARHQYEDDVMVYENLHEIEQSLNTSTPNRIRQYRQNLQRTADLAVAALHKVTGVQKSYPGIRLSSRIPVTLLELAPAVWNAHYMQAIAAHFKNISVISHIVTNTSGWCPSLRQTVSGLLDDDKVNDQRPDALNLNETQVLLHNSAQERLWNLLRSTIKVDIGIKGAEKNINHDSNRTMLKDLETQLVGHGNFDLSEAGAMEDPFEDRVYEQPDPTAESEIDQPPGYRCPLPHVYNDIHMGIGGSYDGRDGDYDYGNEYEHEYEDETQTDALESRGIESARTLLALDNDITLGDEHRHEDDYDDEVMYDTARHGEQDEYGDLALQNQESHQIRRARHSEGPYGYGYGSKDNQWSDYGGING